MIWPSRAPSCLIQPRLPLLMSKWKKSNCPSDSFSRLRIMSRTRPCRARKPTRMRTQRNTSPTMTCLEVIRERMHGSARGTKPHSCPSSPTSYTMSTCRSWTLRTWKSALWCGSHTSYPKGSLVRKYLLTPYRVLCHLDGKGVALSPVSLLGRYGIIFLAPEELRRTPRFAHSLL